ncbi:hypothetical protein I4U23_022933 [Adineta vaga]|nr:hypothetical protein I4U23_022933 [Adineta vaga]
MQRIFHIIIITTIFVICIIRGQVIESNGCGCCPTAYCRLKSTSCSTNGDCECLWMSMTGGGMCADTLVSCNNLIRCENDNMTCSAANTVCVNNTRCEGPVCYPIERASSQRCPPLGSTITNSTTTTITASSTTSTTTKTTSSSSTSSTTANTVSLSLSGVQLNLNPSSLPNGWTLCYTATYAAAMGTYSLPTILSICNKNKLLLGCRPVNTTILIVAAMGNRNDVLYNCSMSTSCTNVANGVGWYYSDSYSWGFISGDDTVLRNSCDTGSTNAAYRLCWHTQNNGGYRCGSAIGLNSDSTWEKVIYHAS